MNNHRKQSVNIYLCKYTYNEETINYYIYVHAKYAYAILRGGGGEERRGGRGALSLQNEDLTPQEGWEENPGAPANAG